MNNKPVYLTAEGLEKLKSELQHLVTVERPRVAARIHDAKMDGDITENAEYEDAKQEQSFLEGRIATLVGSAEAAPREGRISNESPVGAALMGSRKGDKVTVHAPAGSVTYMVVSVG